MALMISANKIIVGIRILALNSGILYRFINLVAVIPSKESTSSLNCCGLIVVIGSLSLYPINCKIKRASSPENMTFLILNNCNSSRNGLIIRCKYSVIAVLNDVEAL